MNSTPLSPGQIKKGRTTYNLFQFINALSFPLINGSIITLFAIKLGADANMLGILSGFNYLAFTLVVLGKALEPTFGMSRVMAWAWLLRSICMIPILFAILFAMHANFTMALFMVLISNIGFNIMRGPGFVANNPIIVMLSTPQTWGKYLSFTLMLNFGGTILSTVVLGLILRVSQSFQSYTILLAAGIGLGFWSSYLLFLLPNPPQAVATQSFISTMREAFARPAFRTFSIVFFFISFITAATRPFLVVYTRNVYGQSDSNAILFTVVGAFGAFFMSSFSRTLVQAVGAKTLFIFFTGLATVSLIPAIISPHLEGLTFILFMGLFHLVATFGMQGLESTGQTYLFGVIRKDELVDASILYFTVFGLGGALGSITGGALLSWFQMMMSMKVSFQVYFSIALVAMIGLLVMIGYLKNTHQSSVRSGLSVLFSPRDIHAINLGHRLEIADSEELASLLKQLGRSESEAATELLVESLKSPQFMLRRTALSAIENLPTSRNPEIVQLLLNQMQNHTFTTGHVAARILGKHHIHQGIPALRRAVFHSADYRTQGESIVALGRLQDKKSLLLIRKQVRMENNEFVIISALNALNQMIEPVDLFVLLRPLAWSQPSKTLIHEALLSAGELLASNGSFYRQYTAFLNDRGVAYLELRDNIIGKKRLSNDKKLLLEPLLQCPDPLKFRQLCQEILPKVPFGERIAEAYPAIYRASQNPLFIRHPEFRFFLVSLMTQQLTTNPKQNRLF
jgi:hypothetical protein